MVAVVNGYVCFSSCDAAKAKQGKDPNAPPGAHPIRPRRTIRPSRSPLSTASRPPCSAARSRISPTRSPPRTAPSNAKRLSSRIRSIAWRGMARPRVLNAGRMASAADNLRNSRPPARCAAAWWSRRRLRPSSPSRTRGDGARRHRRPAARFAAALELPLDLQVYDNSGQVTEAVAGGACDVAFMPHDAARAEKVDFGPPYFIMRAPIWCRPAPPSKASTRSTGRACASSPSPTPPPRAARAAPRPLPST